MNQSTTSSCNRTRLLIHSKRFSKGVVKAFLQKEAHKQLFEQIIHDPTGDHEKQLHEAFQAYYTEIRFVSYMSKLIIHVARDHRVKRQKQQRIFSYTLDQPVNKEGDTRSALDLIVGEEEVSYEVQHLVDEVTNPCLYDSFHHLTKRQRQVLEVHILHEQSYTSIAERFGISQQSVSSTCKRALRKLRESYEKGREHD
ncbi:sigma-70 family RNA polymerase sigma factor [Metabacillus iocasae]|uniref:RNA polymerase sigma factor (Sigma-70 family) n=1 Tax=Priestia iocasae TaxID=2291674 RepID=A0ABS2QSI0_9BACI|nr:sigma-70 family RNA polymerase sigma factor [Metabacillus iocasae]MBM7702411.1 RNA polymerase sigma factor (sigma-70 family) [Metabacillus iocasae]